MLVIRDAQMRALQEAMDRQFVHRLAVAIGNRRPRHPATQSDAPLAQTVSKYVGEARAYGITSALVIADYVGLKFDVGFSLNQHPAVRALLEDPALEPNSKIDRLMLSFTDDEWRGIRAFCLKSEVE